MEANTAAPGNPYELAASEQVALLSLALKASVECLDGLSAMNVALSRTLEESAQQISASQALIKRISRLANLDAKMAGLPTQHGSELQAILLATNEDFSSAVDFNAWKGRLNISNQADNFQAAQGSPEPARAQAPETGKGGADGQQGKQEEGGR